MADFAINAPLKKAKKLTGTVTKAGREGLSAYQVAQKNGFTGSEAEWLESLKGEKGDQGIPGTAAAKGDPGKDGTSVTVISVTESTEDGGSNVVVFSDGTTMTIRNGSKGDPGADGLNGFSIYYTSVEIGYSDEPEASGSVSVQGINKTLINTYGRSVQTGDFILGSNGVLAIARTIESGLLPGVIMVSVEPIMSIIGSGGSSEPGAALTVISVTESTEDGGSNVVVFSDGTTITIKNGSKGSKGDQGEPGAKGDKGDQGEPGAPGEPGKTPVKGVDYFTEEDVAKFVEAVKSTDSGIPEYWKEHIDAKVATIKAQQDEGGKDCFSFVVMTDLHYPSNLGNNAPILAKYICENCDIKFVLCLGDSRTRGLRPAKEHVITEFEELEAILLPIRDRLLQTQGNHDAGYGTADYNGDGVADTYAFELTHAEIFNRIFRKAGMVGECHYDETGTGYYIDDVSNRVRYIMLNTSCNSEELNENGTVKYPSMRIFRYTQSQYDLIVEALNSITGEDWSVVVASHVPINQTGEMPEGDVMLGVLNAYKNRTTYTGTFEGTADGAADVINMADPENESWKDGYRFSSSGESAQTGTTVSNMIPCTNGDTVRIKGVSLREGTDRISVYADTLAYTAGYFNNGVTSGNENLVNYEGLADGVYTLKIATGISHTIKGIRFAMPTPADAAEVIVTVNEEENTGGGYDAVSVACDFTEAKGELISYHAGHNHADREWNINGIPIITTRCDAAEENDATLKAERIAGTITEQSFDVFTVNRKTSTIHATKIGAGSDREISC